MAKTLKEGYTSKKVQRLRARLQPLDERVIAEARVDRLIMEAFDKQQMTAAIDIVKKLKAINFGGLTSLAQGRDAAVSDVTRVLSGSQDKGLIRKIVGLFKSDKENPLVDTLAFADALRNFFDQFTQYASALGSDDESQTLGQIVTGKSPDELADISAVQGLGGPEKQKLDQLQKVIINGLKPEGALAKLGKTWIDKYMKGRKGLQLLAKDMLKVSLKDLKAMATSVSSSLQNTAAVGQAAAGAAQQGAVRTTGSTGSGAAQAGAASTGSVGTKSPATAPGAQVAPGAAGGGANKAFTDLKDAGVGKEHGVNDGALKAILAALEEKGYLK